VEVCVSVPPFVERLAQVRLALDRTALTTLQLNLGKRCNQACTHCHVAAGPKRTEVMEADTVERLTELLAAAPSVRTVDLTGGAPELNPSFRHLVRSARALGREVINRCNLTVLLEPGQEDTAAFFAEQGVHVVASMPCYTQKNVDKQRGKGVFDGSLEGLRRLNALGYGVPGTGLILDLVYNPGGAFLPGSQVSLEADYRRRLFEDLGLVFSQLLTITNMPIARFADGLERSGQLDSYRQLLSDSFNPSAARAVMCRSLVSVSWDGRLYDCDFNQMLELPEPSGRTIWDLQSLEALNAGPIALADHCYGCTAGCGSSCGGALDEAAA